MIANLPSYPVFAFFCGLFGGSEDATLEEVRRGADLSTRMKPLAWLFLKSYAIGATISPLHNRFPITNRQAALDEAIPLTHERAIMKKKASPFGLAENKYIQFVLFLNLACPETALHYHFKSHGMTAGLARLKEVAITLPGIICKPDRVGVVISIKCYQE
jgi:hypothetical protein